MIGAPAPPNGHKKPGTEGITSGPLMPRGPSVRETCDRSHLSRNLPESPLSPLEKDPSVCPPKWHLSPWGPLGGWGRGPPLRFTLREAVQTLFFAPSGQGPSANGQAPRFARLPFAHCLRAAYPGEVRGHMSSHLPPFHGYRFGLPGLLPQTA